MQPVGPRATTTTQRKAAAARYKTSQAAKKKARKAAPADAKWRPLTGIVRHTFTHFHLELTVWAGKASRKPATGEFVAIDCFSDYALPTVMKKVARHAMGKMEK